MADEPFDPKAYLSSISPEPEASSGFDPKAYLKTATAPAPVFDQPQPLPRQTGRERQRAYLGSIHSGSTSSAAGREAPGPDLSSEQATAGQIGSEWGDVGIGMAKGVPATLSGGILGDIESAGRGTINAFAPPKEPFVSPETAIPTTTEGGYLGRRDPRFGAQNPREAAGMSITSALLPTGIAKGVQIARRVPPIPPDMPGPPGGPAAVVREGSGARLLPAEVPHTPLPAGTSTVGAAAGSGPLEGISPETISHMRKLLSEEGVTPWTLDQRLSEMSPHQFLGEFSPNTEWNMRAVAGPPGQGKLEIVNSVGQRTKEAGERLRGTFDTAFGEVENLAQLKKLRDIEQKKASDPLYQEFKSLRIPPSQQIEALIPRLEAVGAFGEAKAFAAAKGIPWDAEAFQYGPFTRDRLPTAESWQLVKEALDAKIDGSFRPDGRPSKWTMVYTQMKNELVNAIDNHPNQQVAGVWKKARQAYAGPEQISEAERLAKKFFTLDADELPFLTAGYSEPQMAAFRHVVRKELENRLGKPGKTELRTMNEVLAPNNEAKFRWVIGDEQTNNLLRGVEHEFNMHGLSQKISGQSQTAPLTEAMKNWTPQPGASLGELIKEIEPTKPIKSVMQVGRKIGVIPDRETAAAQKFAKMREEAARIYTLQGPERDAVLRYLMQPEAPFQRGGRVLHRAAGGRAVGHRPSRPLLADARKAPDGKFYIPDKSRPGKYLRVDE